MKIIILFLVLIIPLPLLSANYTLEELLSHAMENNTSLKQANLNLNISRTRLASSRVNYLPDLSTGIGRTERFDNIQFENQQTSNQAYFSITKSISLNDDTYFSNKNARHDYNTAMITHEIQRQNIFFEIINNYIAVLENQGRLNLLDEHIKIQESIVFESNQLFRQNKITSFEVQQSEINLLNARISALSAKNNLNLSRKRLFDLINITDEGHELSAVTLYESEDTENFTRDINFDKILQIRQQNEVAQKHRTSITQTKLDFFPQMNLSYSYRRNVFSEDFAFDNGSTDHTVGLNLSYSLNRLFRNYYTNKQANYLDEHNKLTTSQLIKDTSLKYNQYIEELNYLQQMNDLLRIKLQQTTSNLEMAQQRYRLGLVTQLDLDKASYENLDSRINMEANLYQLIMKKLSIDHLLSNKLY